jgi:hypothetical protein
MVRSPGFTPVQLCVGKLSVFSAYVASAAMVSRPLYWLTDGSVKSNAFSSSLPGKRKLMLENVIAASFVAASSSPESSNSACVGSGLPSAATIGRIFR